MDQDFITDPNLTLWVQAGHTHCGQETWFEPVNAVGDLTTLGFTHKWEVSSILSESGSGVFSESTFSNTFEERTHTHVKRHVAQYFGGAPTNGKGKPLVVGTPRLVDDESLAEGLAA